MNNSWGHLMINKKFSIVIYLLSTILVIILSIFIFKIITHISYVYVNDEITLSKYTGEIISNPYSENPAKIATYTGTSTGSPIIGLSSADVVLEFLNNSYAITYKAIFDQDAAKKISGESSIKEYSNSYLPKFNFSNNIETSAIKGKAATNIFVSFYEDLSSNFIYQDGEYYHYKGLLMDKDTTSPVKSTNVIVQYINGNVTNEDTLNSSENNGSGLLFCNGRVQDIMWNKNEGSPIKIVDVHRNRITLMPGHTWWIFIDKNCSVSYD